MGLVLFVHIPSEGFFTTMSLVATNVGVRDVSGPLGAFARFATYQSNRAMLVSLFM